jgi:hypothetical protein
MGDDERRPLLREVTQSGSEQIPLRPYLVSPNDIDTEPVPGCDQSAVAGFHETGVVDPAGEQGGDFQFGLRARRMRDGQAGKAGCQRQDAAAIRMV